MIILRSEMSGSILDVGGGGKGVIGRLYGAQVVAIDNRQEELDEAPGGFQKVLMDARRLSFPDGHFDHVTFFYSLMFMDVRTQRQAILEACRVLKGGGSLRIWDADIPSASPEPFIADLDIQLSSERLHTTFGVRSDIRNQSAASVIALCSGCGLALMERRGANGHFYLRFHRRCGEGTDRPDALAAACKPKDDGAEGM